MTPQNGLAAETRCEACDLSGSEVPGSENGPSSIGDLAFIKKGYRILRCPRCGLLWTVIPDRFDPKEVYTKEFFQGGVPYGYHDYLGTERLLTHENADRVRLVRSFKPQGKLLEIGCATGAFLTQAESHFSVQGIDVSPFAVEAARSKGLDVDCSSLEESTIVCPPYDVVVLFDTIEHLPSPRQTLQRVLSILCKDGHVFMTTGDANCFLARTSGKNWRLFTPPQHLWFFNRDNIVILLQRLGFEIVSIRHLWRRVPLSLVWYQLFRGRVKPLPVTLGKAVVKINLYDIMTVVARKPG